MKIHSVRIRNFRGFEDQTIQFDDHTCLVGPNGCGKSTVLAALNVFFQEHSSATDVAVLSAEDFHNGNTTEPVEITVTFTSLSEKAKEVLGHYVRHNELTVSAVANLDGIGRAPVQQYGEQLIFKKFAPFFEDDKNGALVDPLRSRYAEVTTGVDGMPSLGNKPTKKAMISALRAYEEQHPELCDGERSTDLFYGSTRGKGQLEPFIQWVYLPAVKDASEEAEETGNTALGKLLQRTVRKKVNFDDALEDLRQKTRVQYDALLEQEQGVLKQLSESLATKLATFAHPGAGLAVEWLQGSEKSVSIADPRAMIKAQEGKFKGSLTRFGHGLQRSFLLAILQELALLEENEDSDGEQPTLILACEEPELYQHPPQARHLANVLRSLTEAGNQVMLTTHSAYFVSSDAFEEIRLVRKRSDSGKCYVRSTDFSRFADRYGKAAGKKPDKPEVARAKLYRALRPELAEMYFCQKLVLVEGLEDRAYISTSLLLGGKWDDIRRAGLHIVPTDRKSGILPLLVIAQELEIAFFVVFDADGNVTKPEHRALHERDNKSLMSALGIASDPFPKANLWGDTYAVWPNTLETEVEKSIGATEWNGFVNAARKSFDPGASLEKNPLLIAESLSLAWQAKKPPAVLTELTNRLLKFAGS